MKNPSVPLSAVTKLRSLSQLPSAARWLGLWLLLIARGHEVNGAISGVVGHYVGAWTNLTFGSTGKAVIDISQATATTATILFDMDGAVFGGFNPPPITMPGTIVGDVIQIDNHGEGIFGDIKGSIDSKKGTFSVALANIPGNFISTVTADGTVSAGHMQLTYIVHFPGALSPTNPAHGVMDVRTPAPVVIQKFVPEGGKYRLEWTGPGGSYQVQSRADLNSGTWSNVGVPTTATSTLVAPSGTRQFFRVTLP